MGAGTKEEGREGGRKEGREGGREGGVQKDRPDAGGIVSVIEREGERLEIFGYQPLLLQYYYYQAIGVTTLGVVFLLLASVVMSFLYCILSLYPSLPGCALGPRAHKRPRPRNGFCGYRG